MRVALISDIHSNLEALAATLKSIDTQGTDHVVCLGDIVGYNTNPNECIQLLRRRNVVCIAGNHDRAVTGQITTSGFDYTAQRAIDWTRKRLSPESSDFLLSLPVELNLYNKLVAVHGALHPKRDKETVRLDNDASRYLSFQALKAHPSTARVCAFGHTHQLGVYELRQGVTSASNMYSSMLHKDGWYLINPGTVGQPRTADLRASYIVVDFSCAEVTNHYVEYDIAVPIGKSRAEGLIPLTDFLPEPFRSILLCCPKPLRSALRKRLDRFWVR
jgi:predicted phosphodiesterase